MSIKIKAAWAKFRSLPWVVRWSTYTISVYLCYAALFGLLVPYIAKQQIPEQLSKLVERPVTLTDITINPFTLQIDIKGFAILENDQTPFIKFDHASSQVNLWQSLFNGAVSIEYVSLDKPYINVERLDNQNALLFNFSDMLVPMTRNTETDLAQSEDQIADEAVDRHAPLFPLQIKQTTLNGGDVRFVDGVTGTQLHYPNIDVTLGEFATQGLLSDSAQINQYKLLITDADSATLALNGQVQLKPLKVVGDVAINHIQLPRLWGFIEKDLTAKLTSGTVSFSSQYQIAQTLGETQASDAISISTSKGMFALNQINVNAGDKSIVALTHFAVNDIATDVDAQTVNIGSLTSQGLSVVANIDRKGVDLVSLLTPHSSAQLSDESNEELNVNAKVEQTAEIQPSAAPQSNEATNSAWLVTLNGVEIKDYQFEVTEEVATNKANQWVFSPINLTTGQIVSDLSQPIDFDLFMSVNGQGDISFKGQADAKQQAILADIDVKSLKLAQFQPYLSTAINATLTSGEVNAQTQLNANAGGQVTVNGSVQLNHLSVRDNKLKKPFVKWRSLALNQFKFDLQAATLLVDSLNISEPYARVVINQDRSTNIGDLMVTQSKSQPQISEVSGSEVGSSDKSELATVNDAKVASQSRSDNTKSDQSAKPFALSVRSITFNNGSAFFADNSLTPNFSSGIEQLKGTISHVSSIPGTKASVDISGNIDKYAPVRVKGDINPLLEQPYLDLDVIFKSVELTTVNPYSGTYAGHYIDRGQLTLMLNYQLENNQLKGSNHVVIDQLKLGQASDSDLATSLPIKLAIALLQDSDGVIDLGMEVSGDVNDPEFSLGAIIWNTISNIITKAVTAPFSFLSDLAGSDEELNIIAFDYGQNTLTLEEQEKLDTLGKALETRPKLTLTVDGAVDAAPDTKALELGQFQQLLADSAQITVAELPADLSASTLPVSGVLSNAMKALYLAEYGEEAITVREQIENEAVSQEVTLTKEDLEHRWHIALYNLVLNKQKLEDGSLGRLAQQRAQAVKAYLVDVVNVDASRVFLLDSRFDIDKDKSSVSLTLEAD
ncbi:DUF748 domain-containing protein [Vibrio renipiscarius]|uniref:DUF748 domain-containing protein n=1 Tax=Vibrio renipiscarius TaxID=1461322 RepID=UPI0035515171